MQQKRMNQKKNARIHHLLVEIYLYQQKFKEVQDLFLYQDHQSYLLKMRKKKYHYRLHPNQNQMIQMEQEILVREEEWNNLSYVEGYYLVKQRVKDKGQYQESGQEAY